MTDIFISYRRQDAAADAGRLYDDLRERFLRTEIFMDLEAIPPGKDFRASLAENVASAEVVLVLMGPRWLDIRNEATGERRLDEAVDYVRFEIEMALAKGKLVIPVLLPGARMPSPEQLPGSIRDLAYRNAYELGYKNWRFHVDQLTRQLPGKWGAPGRAAPAKPTWKTWALVLGVSIPMLTILHVFAVLNLSFDPQFLLAGVALLLGLYAGRLSFTMLEQSILGLTISLSTGLLTSAIIGIVFDQGILSGSFTLLAGFVGILFVGYLAGTLLLPVFSKARRPSHSP
jgi:hypothetical protein